MYKRTSYIRPSTPSRGPSLGQRPPNKRKRGSKNTPISQPNAPGNPPSKPSIVSTTNFPPPNPLPKPAEILNETTRLSSREQARRPTANPDISLKSGSQRDPAREARPAPPGQRRSCYFFSSSSFFPCLSARPSTSPSPTHWDSRPGLRELKLSCTVPRVQLAHSASPKVEKKTGKQGEGTPLSSSSRGKSRKEIETSASRLPYIYIHPPPLRRIPTNAM